MTLTTEFPERKTMSKSKSMTVAEAATQIGCSKQALMRQIKNHNEGTGIGLKAKRVDDNFGPYYFHYEINPSDLKRYLSADRRGGRKLGQRILKES